MVKFTAFENNCPSVACTEMTKGALDRSVVGASRRSHLAGVLVDCESSAGVIAQHVAGVLAVAEIFSLNPD